MLVIHLLTSVRDGAGTACACRFQLGKAESSRARAEVSKQNGKELHLYSSVRAFKIDLGLRSP